MIKTKAAAKAACIIVAALLLVPLREAAAVKTVAPDGPYPVGVRVLFQELSGRQAPVMVWYPAKAQAGAEIHKYHGKLSGAAVFGAEPDQGQAPYPLIMFSHGMGGCGNSTIFYVENLASHGYVIVSTDHYDSAMCHIRGKPDIGPGKVALAYIKGRGNLTRTVAILFEEKFEDINLDFSYRPAEASATIDQALKWSRSPDSFLYGMMNPDRIGITGHSLGGFTTLMVGGVPFHCEGGAPPPEECEVDLKKTRKINPCCMEYIRETDPYQFRDKRVKAMLATGPAVIFPDLPRAAAEIEIPFMIITGSHKKMEVPWEPIWTLYINAPAPKYLVRVRKSDHMTISDKTLTMGPIIRPFLPGYRFHFKDKAQVYKDYSVAFFDLYLKGDHAKAATLQRPTNKFAELWSEGQ